MGRGPFFENAVEPLNVDPNPYHEQVTILHIVAKLDAKQNQPHMTSTMQSGINIIICVPTITIIHNPSSPTHFSVH